MDRADLTESLINRSQGYHPGDYGTNEEVGEEILISIGPDHPNYTDSECERTGSHHDSSLSPSDPDENNTASEDENQSDEDEDDSSVSPEDQPEQEKIQTLIFWYAVSTGLTVGAIALGSIMLNDDNTQQNINTVFTGSLILNTLEILICPSEFRTILRLDQKNRGCNTLKLPVHTVFAAFSGMYFAINSFQGKNEAAQTKRQGLFTAAGIGGLVGGFALDVVTSVAKCCSY